MREPLENFTEGQWWIRELDCLQNTTDDQKRAVAVVHHMLDSAKITVNELALTKQKLAAAEKAIRESQDQEPEAWIVMVEGDYLHVRTTDPKEYDDPDEAGIFQHLLTYVPLYKKPVIIPESAAQLHIKELREQLAYVLDITTNIHKVAFPKAEKILAKQPDTRALDKALLDAELKGLENIAGREWTGRRKVVKEKLAELNKEPGK